MFVIVMMMMMIICCTTTTADSVDMFVEEFYDGTISSSSGNITT